MTDNAAMTHSPGTQARVVAARVLDAVLHRGRSMKAELGQALPSLPDPRDRALVEAICFAALRQHARTDAALRAWISKPLGRRDDELRALLHAGIAQLDPLGLAAHAAVAATVEATRVIGRTHQVGLVNAVLRRAQREGLPAIAADGNWPAWLRKLLRADWPDDYDAIIAASAMPASPWLRVNRLHGSRDAYAVRLREAGIESTWLEGFDDGLRLEGSVAVSTLPGFAQGDVSVQDGSAQAVADALAPAIGARVLDACAAPGGKAAHLLERDPSLRMTALDIDGKRLAQVRATFMRLGVGADVAMQVADAAELEAWWNPDADAAFDAVLLDAPCSATGIVRRQPDVLLHRRASDLDALLATQHRLLDAAWRVLRPGGVLLYATCSILQAENAQQIDGFLARTPDAVAEPLHARHGRVAGAGRQRLPGEDGMDGFFYARLRKR